MKSSARVVITMMIFLSFTIICTLICARLAFAEASSDQSRKRLDDLFRWRVSDTLQLDSKQETQFGNVLDRVHEKRHKAGDEMSRIVLDISKTENKKQIETLISQYEKQMKIYGETQAEELNELKKVFGTEKLGRYLVFKSELGRKLKTALSSAQPGGPPTSSPATDRPTDKPDGSLSTPATHSKEKIPDPSIIDNE